MLVPSDDSEFSMKRLTITMAAATAIMLCLDAGPAVAGGKPTPLAVSFGAIGTPLQLATADLDQARETIAVRPDFGGCTALRIA